MVDSADKVKAFENFSLEAAANAPAAEEKPAAAAEEKPAAPAQKKPKKKKAAAAGGGASKNRLKSLYIHPFFLRLPEASEGRYASPVSHYEERRLPSIFPYLTPVL